MHVSIPSIIIKPHNISPPAMFLYNMYCKPTSNREMMYAGIDLVTMAAMKAPLATNHAPFSRLQSPLYLTLR